MIPNGPQRVAITRRITELQDASRPGPERDMLEILGKLVLRYSTARTDAQTAEVTIEGYLDALEDLPAWAVREAIRRWRRGDVPATPDERRFAPSEARLRSVALSLQQVVLGQAARMQRVLDAEPERPLTDADRAENERHLARMSADIQAAASMAPSPTTGRTPAEQDAVTNAEAAHWQRWLAERDQGEGEGNE
jgi:hypothetical protein